MDYDFLPIGSVVKLQNSTMLVMISGYFSVVISDEKKVWDYLGFRYPIGYVTDDEIISFDHNQIELVVAYGYRDIEVDEFIGEIKEAKKEIDLDNREEL